MGDGEKERDPALDPARATFEKSIVARVAIPAGAVLEPRDADDEAARQRDPGAAPGRGRRPPRRPRRSSRNHLLEEADLA